MFHYFIVLQIFGSFIIIYLIVDISNALILLSLILQVTNLFCWHFVRYQLFWLRFYHIQILVVDILPDTKFVGGYLHNDGYEQRRQGTIEGHIFIKNNPLSLLGGKCYQAEKADFLLNPLAKMLVFAHLYHTIYCYDSERTIREYDIQTFTAQ